MQIGELIIVLSMITILSFTICISIKFKEYSDRNNSYLKAIYVKKIFEAEIDRIVNQYSMNIPSRAKIYLPYPIQVVNNIIYVDGYRVELNRMVFGNASGYRITLIYDGEKILVRDG